MLDSPARERTSSSACDTSGRRLCHDAEVEEEWRPKPCEVRACLVWRATGVAETAVGSRRGCSRLLLATSLCLVSLPSWLTAVTGSESKSEEDEDEYEYENQDGQDSV